MRLSKFERQRQEMVERQKRELEELAEKENRELARMIEPVVEKIARIARDEARKLLERNPDILETYSFRKREVARGLSGAIHEILSSETSETGQGKDDGAPEERVKNSAGDDRRVAGHDSLAEMSGNGAPDGGGAVSSDES